MKVSVIIPCYHADKFLPSAIECLRAQTYFGEWEAILVDDGDPAQFADNRVELPANCRLVHLTENRGLSAARNAGLAVAKGEIILFYDPDDTIRPDFVEHMARDIQGVDLVWGYFDGQANTPKPPKGEIFPWAARKIFGYRLIDWLIWWTPKRMWKNCGRELVALPAKAFRRELCPQFDETIGLFEDSIFLAEYSRRAKTMRLIGESGYKYYVRETGLMMRELDPEKRLKHRFTLRDARRRVDSTMHFWRGSFVLSALDVLRLGGVSEFWRFVTFKEKK